MENQLISHIIKKNDAYVSRCRGAGHLTNGVWMHRDPLTCCALSFLHGIESDSKLCDCAYFNDECDLDPTTNTILARELSFLILKVLRKIVSRLLHFMLFL